MLTAIIGLITSASSLFGAAVTVPDNAVDILSEKSNWRWNTYLKSPTISIEEMKVAGKTVDAPVPFKGKQVVPPYLSVDHINGILPPKNWQATEYDDSTWPRAELTKIEHAAFSKRFSTMSVRLRGKFSVKNPASVKALYLNMKFYGGVVVYINGKEVSRLYLPKGELKLDTLADQYPQDAQIGVNGIPIPSARFRRKLTKKDPDLKAKLDAQAESRWRKMETIKIPANILKSGVNVLAIEVRRSHYPALAKKGWFKGGKGAWGLPSWVPVNLSEVSLKAVGGDIISGNSRPSGMQVWTEDRNVRITFKDFGNPAEDIAPIKITGAQNGTFSGQIVVSSDKEIKGLKVQASALKAAKGTAIISKANTKLLYAVADVEYYGTPKWFNALESKPIKNIAIDKKYASAVQPITVQVSIPKDARAGDYNGVITISATGEKPVKVPISLHVANWTIPDPKDYKTYIGLYQSPTTISMQYKVPMWSEEHWELLEKSFALLSRAGNKMVNIPVVDKTQFGNEDSYIFWIKQPNGSYKYDFSVFDRYMKLVVKYCGPQDNVVMQIWHASGWHARKSDQENTVTVIDAKTGERSHMQVPTFDTEEALAFWKPLLTELKARLTKMDMPDAMCIGILSDSTAPSPVFEMFDKAMPPVSKWHRGNHTANRSPEPYKADKGGGLVVLHEYCYGLGLPDADKELPEFWNLRNKPATAYERISGHESKMPLSWYRCSATKALLFQTRGVGRACLDFWGVEKGKWIYNRYPRSTCTQRRPSLKKMTWAGPDGAATTIRYETFLEGIQDAEALIYVSKAISQNAKKLGPKLVQECKATISDTIRYQPYNRDRLPLRPYYYGWQNVSARMYECAAKIKQKL